MIDLFKLDWTTENFIEFEATVLIAGAIRIHLELALLVDLTDDQSDEVVLYVFLVGSEGQEVGVLATDRNNLKELYRQLTATTGGVNICH